MTHSPRLIEDYLPIQAISAEASREKSVRKGHISTLHLWWARRPLVACRAAVYGALVPADRWVGEVSLKHPPDDPEKAERVKNGKKLGLNRKAAAKFVTALCKYPGDKAVIAQAESHILEAHADRLTAELQDAAAGTTPVPAWVEEFKFTGARVTVDDIRAGRAPRPRVLDMFAGGGAIPLEALRLGCEAYALDLNPVAHIIELCTLVYPQKYGKPDPTARGMTGPPSYDQAGRLIHQSTWGGLADEVRYWGNWVLEKVRAEIGDLYPPIPDPEAGKQSKAGGTGGPPVQGDLFTTRRNLPHWELAGSTYFITYRCVRGVVLSEEQRSLVLSNWIHWHGKRYLLHAAVVMPDHVHVLITPKSKPDSSCFSLEEILHTNKSYTAHEIAKSARRRGSTWQDERFDRIVRDQAEFDEKWNYMANNPVKRELVERPEEYAWLYQNPHAWDDDKGSGTAGPAVQAGTGRRPVPPGYLTPVAYLWTRTVKCKNPACGATVPLARQTWLCKKKDRYVALKPVPDKKTKRVRFQVVESASEKGLGFDPAAGSKGGNATCSFCGSVADIDYVKDEGWAGRMGTQFMAAVCMRPNHQGKLYLSAADCGDCVPSDEKVNTRLDSVLERSNLSCPDEPIANLPKDSKDNTLGITVRPYGFRCFSDLFLPRQLLSLLTATWGVRKALQTLKNASDGDRAIAVVTYLACIVDRLADFNSALCVHNYFGSSRIANTFGRQVINMVWDCAEANPFHEGSGGWGVDAITEALSSGDAVAPTAANVRRGSATQIDLPSGHLDAVVTDPPYYDNVPYADISDYFYVWLKRSIGDLYPEHFAMACTPKRAEAIADAGRHGGDWHRAKRSYENMMQSAFARIHQALKPQGLIGIVYAHKTTLGWATLVDALRRAGFTVSEAWPLDTEKPGRLRAQDSAALASSILLVARKREGTSTAEYETTVRPELETVVRERVNTLWEMGISGADLLIASVGAGLRAFTRFARVEYANGEEVPAERFLSEVETVVLETILTRLSKEVVGQAAVGQGAVGQAARLSAPSQAGGLSHLDPATRFYLLWRYTYRTGELDAGEAIVFANGTHVELDGPGSLSYGARALVAKKKAKYRLLDFTQRGDEERLGLPDRETGQPAPLVDALHRVLWLMEHAPLRLAEYLEQSGVDREQLRLVAQALAGPVLKGGDLTGFAPSAELSALAKLTANWKSVVEEATLTPGEREARRTGQKTFRFDRE